MKQSSYIQLPDAIRFIDASSEAYRLLTPWNCFITLHLESAGIDPLNASKHVIDGIQRLGKYHKRNGMSFSYGWVLENGLTKGVHLHLLVHRPKKLPMHPMAYCWAILRCFKIKRTKDILRVEKFRSGQSYFENIRQVASYCLKGLRAGTDYKFEDLTGLQLSKDLKDQGVIYGKRIGWSKQNI